MAIDDQISFTFRLVKHLTLITNVCSMIKLEYRIVH